jgi:polysaccharide pyruvyl transferase WcaK-like protein
MRLIAPFGFYGAGNIGDEATMTGFAALLQGRQPGAHVSLASMNPAHTSRISPAFRHFRTHGFDPRRWIADKRADAVVFPGGTPVMDCLGDWPLSEVVPLVRDAHYRGRPVAFVGVGTETLERDKSRRAVREVLGPHVRHWSVRSASDRARLLEYGVPAANVTTAADMGWLLDPVSKDEGESLLRKSGIDPAQKLIGVNAMAESAALRKEPALFDKLAAVLDGLIDRHDAHVLFLANEIRLDDTFDQAAHRQIRLRMRRTHRTSAAPVKYWSPNQMMSLIACCASTISMRYHFCLFSAVQEVPFIALQRSDKVADLCRDLHWTGGVPLAALDPNTVISLYDDIEQKREALLVQLSRNREALRKRAGSNVAALGALQPDTLAHPVLRELGA